MQLVYGEEPHHVAEAIFKCLARALDVATQIEPRAAGQLPSTKGRCRRRVPIHPHIAVIDTGICNLRSVTKALEAVGASPRVVRTPAELSAPARRGLVLPGVGALRDCVAALRARA